MWPIVVSARQKHIYLNENPFQTVWIGLHVRAGATIRLQTIEPCCCCCCCRCHRCTSVSSCLQYRCCCSLPPCYETKTSLFYNSLFSYQAISPSNKSCALKQVVIAAVMRSAELIHSHTLTRTYSMWGLIERSSSPCRCYLTATESGRGNSSGIVLSLINCSTVGCSLSPFRFEI